MIKYSMYIYACLATTFVCMAVGNTAQAQSDASGIWVRSVGGDLMDQVNSLTTDEAGNTYVTGGFQGVSHFDKSEIKADGDTDIFIAKYDKNKTLLWLKGAGSNTMQGYALSEYGTDVVIDHGFVYLTGMFSGAATFEATTIQSEGEGDIFLAKYTLAGALVWVRAAGSKSQDIAQAIATDERGNIYMTGRCQDTVRFGEHVATTLHSTGFFLSKYDANGNVQWVRTSQGSQISEGKDIVVKGDHCFVVGNVQGNANFDGTIIKASQPSAFLGKYTLDGDLKYTQVLATGAMLSVNGIHADRRNIYIVGSFNSPLLMRGKTYDGAGGSDGFLMKADMQGNIQWVNTVGGPGRDIAKKVFVADDKQIVVGGTFTSYLKMESSLVTANGGEDIFVASYSEQGNFNWVDRLGGMSQDRLSDITVHAGQIMLTGHFVGSFTGRGQQQMAAGQTDGLLVGLPLPSTIGYISEDNEQGVAFHPNPASELITVESTEALTVVNIVDISGRSFKEIELDGVYEVQISVREIPAGLYVIKTNSAKGVRTSKLIVKR